MLKTERSTKAGKVFKCQKLAKEKADFLTRLFATGMPAREAADVVGVNKETARMWWDRYRAEIVSEARADDAPLEGDVEADEIYLGPRKKGKRGRGAEGKVIVFGLVERHTGRTRHFIVPDVSAETLLPLIVANVKPGATVHTDEWASYKGLKKLGYHHRTVNHKKAEYAKADGSGTNRKEGDWKNLRRFWGKFNGGWKRYVARPDGKGRDFRRRMGRWLDEAAFRLEAGRKAFLDWCRERWAPVVEWADDASLF